MMYIQFIHPTSWGKYKSFYEIENCEVQNHLHSICLSLNEEWLDLETNALMFHTFCLFQNGFVFRKGTIIDETTPFGSIARHRRRLGSVDMSASQTFESSPITTSIRILLLSYDKCDDDENDDERKKEKKLTMLVGKKNPVDEIAG